MGKILVVEDVQDSFDLIAEAFQDVHEVTRAETGEEALAQVQALRPDLVLLDMGLADLNGWEVARRLKADPETAHVPIIAVTAYAMTGDRTTCLEAGCDDYLSKPIALRALTALVESYLAKTKPGFPGKQKEHMALYGDP